MRHLDYMDFIDGLTDVAMSYPQEDAADLLIRIESYRQLYEAVNRLSTVQRRRLLLHFSDNLRNVHCPYEHSTWLWRQDLNVVFHILPTYTMLNKWPLYALFCHLLFIVLGRILPVFAKTATK